MAKQLRSHIPFIGRELAATTEELRTNSTVPEHVALAGMVLESLNMVPSYRAGLQHATNGTLEAPRAIPDTDYWRAIARMHTGGMRQPSSAGLVRSLLEQGLAVDLYGCDGGTFGLGVTSGLDTAYARFSHYNEQPQVEQVVSSLSGVGGNTAAWVEVRGGLPSEGRATHGELAFLLVEGSTEKVEVHTPGNYELPGEASSIFTPESLLASHAATLIVVSRPIVPADGTLIS